MAGYGVTRFSESFYVNESDHRLIRTIRDPRMATCFLKVHIYFILQLYIEIVQSDLTYMHMHSSRLVTFRIYFLVHVMLMLKSLLVIRRKKRRLVSTIVETYIHDRLTVLSL